MPSRIPLGVPALAALATSALLLSTAGTAIADMGPAADTAASPATLTVDGEGQVNVVPDLASLNVTVNRSAATSRAALGAANSRTDLITRAIRALGVPSSEIQTQSVNVANTSHKVGPKHHRLIKRFTASESLFVTSAARVAGAVVDAATHNGASSVNGLSFGFSNPAAGQIAANSAALVNARQQANAAAAALGYTVTGVESVDLNPQSNIVSSGSSSAGSAPPSTTPTTVHPGVQQVDAEVEVVYTIAPAST